MTHGRLDSAIVRAMDTMKRWLPPMVILFACSDCRRASVAAESEVPSARGAADADPNPAVERSALSTALTFHAGFDGSADAGFARGDARIYTATSYKARGDARVGLEAPADVRLVAEGGRFGGALHFPKKNGAAVFFRAKDNVAFDPKGWSGTVSLWLRLDPNVDLEPGYCDPIQVTDASFKDAAIWVDFSKDDDPRQFRLGVFGDHDVWNPENIPPPKNPAFLDRLVPVQGPPFSRDRWTHVVVAYRDLGSGAGEASLYLDAELQGTAKSIEEPFTWEVDRAALRLGLSYVGHFDELAVFDRPLTAAEVRELHELPDGVVGLYPATAGE